MAGKTQQGKQQAREMAEQLGHVFCAECSTPEWEVFHAPDKCPKSLPAMVQRKPRTMNRQVDKNLSRGGTNG